MFGSQQMSDGIVFPPWALRAAADDREQVQALVSDRNAPPGAVSIARSAPMGYWQCRLHGRTMALAQSGAAVAWTVRGAVAAPMLYLDVPPGSRYRIGRQEWIAPRGGMAFLPGNVEFSRQSPPGRFLAVRVDPDALQSEWCARNPRSVQLRAGLHWLATEPQGAHAAYQCALAVVQATAPETDAREQRLAEAAMVACLVDGLQRVHGGGSARAGHAAAARLAALEDWIEAHLAEPLTLGSLCARSGLGARSLQKAFEARRGMSPMRYVVERRLARARARLTRATPLESVTMIALDCGFEHMSRFAQAYRNLFGERPSETLARCLSAPGSRPAAPTAMTPAE